MGKHVGMLHYKSGSTDGVSLEMEKWRQVIERAGHTVFFCSGIHEKEETHPITVIPELNYHTEDASRLQRGMFVTLDHYPEKDKRSAFKHDLESQCALLEMRLATWVEAHAIEVIIPENIWSVALHPAAALALQRVVSKKGLWVLSHHHDFYWERLGSLLLTCPEAMELADTLYPPHNQDYDHAVINSLAQESLLKRKGIKASVIPNVFDFSDPETSTEGFSLDERNKYFRRDIGLLPADIFMLQATRIVPRKGIEMAIEVIAEMNRMLPDLQGRELYNGRTFSKKNQIVLVLSGYSEDDRTGTYLAKLKHLAHRKGVRMIQIDHMLSSSRPSESEGGYSFWDAYAHADIVTYPSYWEGWGNQLLEAMKAKLPVILFEYPVYARDIASKGLDMISLGSNIDSQDAHALVHLAPIRYKEAAERTIEILTNKLKYEKMVERNFSIGREYFSLDALSRYLKPFLEKWN